MKQKIDTELIVSLIKDDIINSKLVNGLNQAGLNADHYYLHLSETILRLMGLEQSILTEHVYEHYLKLIEKVYMLDNFQSTSLIDDLAVEIYLDITKKICNTF